MTILAINQIQKCADAILRGELVGMPTETVYGCAGHGLRADSLAKIFEVKERPTFDPLILHISPELLPKLGEWVKEISPTAEKLMEAFWPGPLTLLFQKTEQVPDLATSGLPEVAIRIPKHAVALELIKLVGAPLAAPSANRFGHISPTSAQDVEKELGPKLFGILDGGACKVGVESTVVRVSQSFCEILRPGGLSREELERVAGVPVRVSTQTALASASPGTLENHYAPRKKLFILPPNDVEAFVKNTLKHEGAKSAYGILMVASTQATPYFHERSFLSDSGSPLEIAQNLFQALRIADESTRDLIFIEPMHSSAGLGLAIQDRIQKASWKG